MDQLPHFLHTVGLIFAECSKLCQLGVRFQSERKGVLICDVPVQHIHFIVHQGIYGLIDDLHGQEMPGRIDQQSSIREFGAVLDFDG